MPAQDRGRISSARPLWSLLDGSLVESTGKGAALRVRGRWGPVELDDGDPLVREALHRMSLGPVCLENIPALRAEFARWRRGQVRHCGAWRRLRQTLDQLGGFVVPSLGLADGGRPMLSVTAVTPDAVFTLPVVDDKLPIRLRHDAAIERLNQERALVCPGLPYQVVLHRPPSTGVVESLLGGTTTIIEVAVALGVDHAVVADVVAYLSGAGLVTFNGD